MTPFGERVRAALDAYGPLCVGIDPHEQLLRAWGLDVSASAVREFGLRVVEAAAGRVGVLKPQVAFYERFGSAGFAALEDVLAAARAAGLLVVADAKRGDIGSTMDAYALAWLQPGAPLEADAVTLSPYLGVGALRATLELALANGKGAFVLAATSNPEATTLQRARSRDETVAGLVAAEVAEFNAQRTPAGRWGSIGLVVGATVDLPHAGLGRGLDGGLDLVAPVLAPGFGAQGARAEDLPALFGALAPAVIANESRSILSAGPAGLAATIGARAAAYAGTRG